jgi:hypothetical protein
MIQQDWMSHFGSDMRLSPDSIEILLSVIQDAGHLQVQDLWQMLLQKQVLMQSESHFYRALGHLLKFNLLSLAA